MNLNRSIAMAVAVGGLKTLSNAEPAPHTRRARLCRELANCILFEAGPRLALLGTVDMRVAEGAILASEKVYLELAEQHKCPQEIIVLNLVSFCMDEIGRLLSRRTLGKLRDVLDCWKADSEYDHIRLGHRVWARLESETEILLAGAGPDA